MNDCVYTFADAANKNNIPHPNLITEGGRSLTAHHSVLILDVLECASMPYMPEDFQPAEGDHQLVRDLTEIWDKLSSRSMLEDWHDAHDLDNLTGHHLRLLRAGFAVRVAGDVL